MHEFTHYQVRDIMTLNPVAVPPHARLRELEAIFEAHDFNALPVIDAERRLVGMVTKLDLLRAFAFGPESMIPLYKDIMERKAEKALNPFPETVAPETPVTRVLHLMVESRKKSFPVVDDGVLEGIVAREDVLRTLREASEGRLPNRLTGQHP